MNITWEISEIDILRIKKVIDQNDNAFLKRRWKRNVEKEHVVIDQNMIIRVMLLCLLTSQQKSGPNTVVGKFLRLNPFPISIESLNQTTDMRLYIRDILEQNGLTRMIDRITGFFVDNIVKIEDDYWKVIPELYELKGNQTKEAEREFSDYLNDLLSGFGPKQSRNFLQTLGLTKYEIPIDSRVVKWLNNNEFPFVLNSSLLNDKGYYHLVSDGLQLLCAKASVYPCILDAAIFSSFDQGEWTEENTIF